MLITSQLTTHSDPAAFPTTLRQSVVSHHNILLPTTGVLQQCAYSVAIVFDCPLKGLLTPFPRFPLRCLPAAGSAPSFQCPSLARLRTSCMGPATTGIRQDSSCLWFGQVLPSCPIDGLGDSPPRQTSQPPQTPAWAFTPRRSWRARQP